MGILISTIKNYKNQYDRKCWLAKAKERDLEAVRFKMELISEGHEDCIIDLHSYPAQIQWCGKKTCTGNYYGKRCIGKKN